MDESFDIIVVGGGTAGVVAAIQCGRAGMRTLLVEKNGLPGGTMTAAGISFPGLFHAWGHQIIAGIGWELVAEAAAESGLPLPDFSNWTGTSRFWRYQVQLNPVVYSALCDEKLLGSGVDVLYHTMVAEVKPEDDTVELRLCTLEGLRTVRARRVIDCTGDASVCALAGYEVIHPSECQPATMSCKLAGYDFSQLDQAGLCAAIDRAVAAGELRYTDLGWNKNGASLQFLSKYGDNANHIFPPLPTHTSEGRSRLEIEARSSLLRARRFLRKQPGMENLSISFGAFECGIRESAVIRGETTVTAEDYCSGKRYPDAVCNSFYPIDLHASAQSIVQRQLEEGTVPQVPLRALVPSGSKLILAAGRCISSDRLANSALRVQATSMATAQAAGAAAAASIRNGTAVLQTPMENIRKILHEHGAIL